MSTISWIPSSEECAVAIPTPIPAKQVMPDWYTSICPVTANTYDYDPASDTVTSSLRNCMPFYDSLTTGYVQTTWCDVFINCTSDGQYKYSSATGKYIPAPLGARTSPPVTSFLHTYPVEFVWYLHWRPKTPKGWSSLICHPLNRHDLPFVTTSGIIDSDLFYHSPSGELPFYVKEGFSGIIPAGTPMYQIIPFKRENWKSVAESFAKEEELKRIAKGKKHAVSSYARLFWVKKRYR
jgi:hypothetical protein